MGRPKKFQVGDRSDHLTVTSIQKVAGKAHAVCLCDCGNSITIRYESLRNAINSCGCHPGANWKGCGNLSASYYGNLRKGARSRGLEFSVSIEHLWQLLEDQSHRCRLSGLPIHLGAITSDRHTASVDRIDSRKGYVLGNVQWVHKDINFMKLRLSQEVFIEMCNRVAAVSRNEKMPDPILLTETKPRRGRKLPDYVRKGWNTRRPKLSVESILADVERYIHLHGRTPSCLEGNTVPNKPDESWSNYDQNLRRGKRGLPGGNSLPRIIAEHGLHRPPAFSM